MTAWASDPVPGIDPVDDTTAWRISFFLA